MGLLAFYGVRAAGLTRSCGVILMQVMHRRAAHNTILLPLKQQTNKAQTPNWQQPKAKPNHTHLQTLSSISAVIKKEKKGFERSRKATKQLPYPAYLVCSRWDTYLPAQRGIDPRRAAECPRPWTRGTPWRRGFFHFGSRHGLVGRTDVMGHAGRFHLPFAKVQAPVYSVWTCQGNNGGAEKVCD